MYFLCFHLDKVFDFLINWAVAICRIGCDLMLHFASCEIYLELLTTHSGVHTLNSLLKRYFSR